MIGVSPAQGCTTSPSCSTTVDPATATETTSSYSARSDALSPGASVQCSVNALAAGRSSGIRGLSYVNVTWAPAATADWSTGTPVATAVTVCRNPAASLPAKSRMRFVPGVQVTSNTVPSGADASTNRVTDLSATWTSVTDTALPPTCTAKSPAAGTEDVSSASSKYSDTAASLPPTRIDCATAPSSRGATPSDRAPISKRSNDCTSGLPDAALLSGEEEGFS